MTNSRHPYNNILPQERMRTSTTSRTGSPENHDHNTTTSTGGGGITTEPGVSIKIVDEGARLGAYLDGREYNEIHQYSDEELEAIFQNEIMPMYEDVMGQEMNCYIAQRLEHVMKRGEISKEVVKLALEETAMARWPTPKYFFAILKRCWGEGIQTTEDWKRQKAAFRNRKNLRYESTADW